MLWALPLGCAPSSDPAAQCVAMDVSVADVTDRVSAAESPLLAMSGIPSNLPVSRSGDLIHSAEINALVAYRSGCRDDGSGCGVRAELYSYSPGSQVLVTQESGYTVLLDDENRNVVTIPSGGGVPRESAYSDRSPVQLVSTLRRSDWYVGRDENRRLRRFHPSHQKPDGEELAPDLNVFVRAVGSRYLLAVEVKSGSDERMHLIPVDPENRRELGQPVEIMGATEFQEAILAADDTRAIITAFEGEATETFVYDLPSMALLDRFAGSVVQKRSREPGAAAIPGLSAVSPDGSHVAYRTSTGSLALRGVDDQSACLVRGPSQGNTRIAGFSADGLLFSEAVVDGSTQTRIFAYDPRNTQSKLLGDPDRAYRLTAVPGRAFGSDRDAEETGIPWAVAASKGTRYAIQFDHDPIALNLDHTAFLPRDDSTLWALDAPRSNQDPFMIRRIEPTFASVRSVAVDVYDTAFSLRFPSQRLCVATGSPASWPTHCGDSEQPTWVNVDAAPNTERPD